jgi:hypothetical protein
MSEMYQNKFPVLVFGVEMPCVCVFSPEDGEGVFLRNVRMYVPTSPREDETLKSVIDIMTARNSDLIILF